MNGLKTILRMFVVGILLGALVLLWVSPGALNSDGPPAPGAVSALVGILLAATVLTLLSKRIIHWPLGNRRMRGLAGVIMAAIALMAWAREAEAQTLPGGKTEIWAFTGVPTFVASNMTTNVTCSGAPLFPGQGFSVISVGRSVTNEATAITISFEFTTNRIGDATTNWFRPRVPVTVVLTNHSGITTNRQFGFVPPSTVDGWSMVRPFSFANAATTNGWTNSWLGIGSFVVKE
jgi:hypothetical protein